MSRPFPDEDAWQQPTRRDHADAERRAIKRAKAVMKVLIKYTLDEALALPLDDSVERSLREWHTIPNKGQRAKSRLEDRLIREVRMTNLKELEVAVGEGSAQRNAKDNAMLALERWRERIFDDGDTIIDAFIEEHPSADRQRLRQLCRQAQKEGKAGKTYRRLFGALREAAGL